MSVTEKLTSALEIVAGTKDVLAIQAVIEVQKDLSLILEENRELREENHRLKNIDILRQELSYKGNSYYKGVEGPFCTTCFDNDGKLIRLILTMNIDDEYLIGNCSVCSSKEIQTVEKNVDYESHKKAVNKKFREFNKLGL